MPYNNRQGKKPLNYLIEKFYLLENDPLYFQSFIILSMLFDSPAK